MIQEEIFNVQELAEYLKVNSTWVYKKVHQRSIPYFKAGKYTRFKKADIDSWIRNQEVKPVEEGLRTVK